MTPNVAANMLLVVIGALVIAPATALAQDAIAAPGEKTIGATKPRIEPSLIVMNARGASLVGGKLALIDVSPSAILFADRPVRAAGHTPTARLLEEWGGGETFADDPPNATVSVLSKDGSTVRDVVVVLRSPKPDGDKLTFDVDVLEGDLAGADGPAAVFIDTIGLPFASLSFAGAASQTAYQGAWYRGYAAASAPYEPGPALAGPGDAMPWQ